MDSEKYKRLIPKSIFDEDFGEGNIGWCSPDSLNRLFELDKGTVLVEEGGSLKYIPVARRTRLNLWSTKNPKKEFNKYLEAYEPNHKKKIATYVSIGKNTVIHDCVEIEHSVVIGDNCTIGGEGFGYVDGERIHHRGKVIIKSGTHIGNNVCIDRGVIDNTEIGENVRIDNLVHIAHGAKIGEESYIVANSTVCGSVVLGRGVWVAPNSVINQKLTVGDYAVIGSGAVVVKDVKANTTVAGVPAKEIKKK